MKTRQTKQPKEVLISGIESQLRTLATMASDARITFTVDSSMQAKQHAVEGIKTVADHIQEMWNLAKAAQ